MGRPQPVRGPQHDPDAGAARQADAEEALENGRHLAMRQAEGLVQRGDGSLGVRADLAGACAQGVGGLERMPPLDAPAAATTTADLNVELANQGASGDFRLILSGNLGLPNGTATMRTSVGKSGVEDFINRFGRRGRAVAVSSVSGAAFAPGRFGLGFGRSLGEGGGLAFRRAACLVEFCLGPGQFPSEAFVIQAKPLVLLTKAFALSAQVAWVRQEGGGDSWRVGILSEWGDYR